MSASLKGPAFIKSFKIVARIFMAAGDGGIVRLKERRASNQKVVKT